MESTLTYDISHEKYLFDENGFMKKDQKSVFIQELEWTLAEKNKKLDFKDLYLKSGVFIDVMAITRKMKLLELKTFGDLSKTISYNY